MELLVDLFGYLSIVLHGLTIVAQSVALGGVLFLVLLGRPLAPRLGTGPQGAGNVIAAGTARIAGCAAIGLVISQIAALALQTAVLMATVDLSVGDALTANSAIAGLVKVFAATALAALLLARPERTP